MSTTPPTVGHVMRAYLARTETFVHNQIATLRGYRPVVVAHHRRPETDVPLGDGIIADEHLGPRLAEIERLVYRMAKSPLPPANAVLERYLRNEGARLLHVHYLTDARFFLGLGRRVRLPTIVSGYGYDVSSFPRRWGGLGRRYLRPVFDQMDLFLAMSDDMRRDVVALGCPEHKVEVHYYGSDTTRFRYPERSYRGNRVPTILCCGRLQTAKGQHLVLEALRMVEHRAGCDFRVRFVGDGPLRPQLERMVGEYGWGDRVAFTGHVPYSSNALVDEFGHADLFAHPSVTVDGLKEGIPGTIVEAMASGLPVVSTLHAGIPAVIDSGTHGLLVREHDLDGLAVAFERLLRDATLRRRLGVAAADRAADELDLRTRTEALERIYDRFV